MAVIPLPSVVINHFGKLTLAAAAAALSGLAYAQRERISRWLDAGDLGTTLHARDKVLTGLHSEPPEALHKDHSELMDKLASSNANAVAELKGLINDIHEELGSMTENFQGELDAQRREVRALGRELHEAIANLKARQDTVEALVNSSPREERVSDGKGEPSASPAPRQTTGRTTAPGGKRKGNGPAGPDSRPA